MLRSGHVDVDGRCQKPGALVLVDDPALALEVAKLRAGVFEVLPPGHDYAGRQQEIEGGGGCGHVATSRIDRAACSIGHILGTSPSRKLQKVHLTCKNSGARYWD